MAMNEVVKTIEESKRSRDRWVAIYIAVLAVILAICSMGGGNVTKEAAQANLDATNLWAFFQARNLRRTHYMIAVEDLELKLKAEPELNAVAKAEVDRLLADYKQRIASYTSDKKTNTGLDELFERAKVLEAQRDAALAKDPYFDYGQALIQIAIVTASIAIVAGSSFFVVLSAIMAVAGTALMLAGFGIVDMSPMADQAMQVLLKVKSAALPAAQK